MAAAGARPPTAVDCCGFRLPRAFLLFAAVVVAWPRATSGGGAATAAPGEREQLPRRFTVEEYQAALEKYPVTRADYSNVGWLGHPRSLALPGFLARFDWLLDHTDWAHRDPQLYVTVVQRQAAMRGNVTLRLTTPEHQKVEDPQTVFATPFAVRRLLVSAMRSFDASHNDRIVVFAGSDQLLSDAFGHNSAEWATTAFWLGKYFRAIFYMAKDVEVEGVKSMPIGLLEHYLRQDHAMETAVRAIESVTHAGSTIKTRSALLAIGGYGDFRNNVSGFDARFYAYESRNGARLWAETAAAKEAGVEARRIEPRAWWDELASYRFLLSPWGDGVQSAKTIEALQVLTVPIVQRGRFPVHDDLVKIGFPLIVVDKWSEITAARLEEWWQALAPRLEEFRRSCLTADGYWRFVTSQIDWCGSFPESED